MKVLFDDGLLNFLEKQTKQSYVFSLCPRLQKINYVVCVTETLFLYEIYYFFTVVQPFITFSVWGLEHRLICITIPDIGGLLRVTLLWIHPIHHK